MAVDAFVFVSKRLSAATAALLCLAAAQLANAAGAATASPTEVRVAIAR
jgi:hypothetical protein